MNLIRAKASVFSSSLASPRGRPSGDPLTKPDKYVIAVAVDVAGRELYHHLLLLLRQQAEKCLLSLVTKPPTLEKVHLSLVVHLRLLLLLLLKMLLLWLLMHHVDSNWPRPMLLGRLGLQAAALHRHALPDARSKLDEDGIGVSRRIPRSELCEDLLLPMWS